MVAQELTDYQIEQDRLDEKEEARLLPIYTAQHEALERFCNWMNSKHPKGAQFRVMPKTKGESKPFIDCVGDFLEFVGEGTDELNFDSCTSEDAYMILWEIFQHDSTKKDD
jgi:hypothetical protein